MKTPRKIKHQRLVYVTNVNDYILFDRLYSANGIPLTDEEQRIVHANKFNTGVLLKFLSLSRPKTEWMRHLKTQQLRSR